MYLESGCLQINFEGREGENLEKQVASVLETKLLLFLGLSEFSQNGGVLQNGMVLANTNYCHCGFGSSHRHCMNA